MPWIQPQGRDEVRSRRVLLVEPFRDFIEWGSRNPVAMQQFDTMFHVEHSGRVTAGPLSLEIRVENTAMHFRFNGRLENQHCTKIRHCKRGMVRHMLRSSLGSPKASWDASSL
jgi:hypothetical protein